jgi:gluconokinase
MSYLIIDVGSSSVRAILYDPQGRAIDGGFVSRPYQFSVSASGASTVDAEYLRDLVEVCVGDILTHPAAQQIRAVGMATFVGNLLGVDKLGNALTPIYTYADTQSKDDASLLAQQMDCDDSHQRTGCLLHTAYHPAKLHWLKRTDPQTFGGVHQWMDFASYLYTHWLGEAKCSYSVASWSGLLNRHTLIWDSEWLSLLGLSDASFPPLADFKAFQQGLTPKYARRWTQLANVQFFLALGDGAAANVGMGAALPETLALTLGSTAALRAVYTDSRNVPDVPAGLWAYRVDKDRHLIGGATSEGGNVLHWLKTMFPSLDFVQAEQEIVQRPADSHGLTCLPLLNGERSPGWHSSATGTIHGLTLSTTPIDVLQAALEGVALRIALIARQLSSLTERVYLGGGAASASPVWCQILANALDKPLCLVAESEVTAHGTALLIANVLNNLPLEDYTPPIAQVFTPQPENVARLAAARERQQELYRRLYS